MTENLTLIDIIQYEMTTDIESREKQSRYLIDAYENSNDPNSIDDFLIALCGWSFQTLKGKLRK